MKQLFDNDVLGTKNVRTKPEYTARKSTRRVMSFWLTIFPVLLLIGVIVFFYIKSDLLFKIADKIAVTWSSMVSPAEEKEDETKDKTASAEEVLEAYSVASVLPLGEHGDGTFEIDANHCCVCCGHAIDHVDDNNDHYCDFPTCAKKFTSCTDTNYDHFCDKVNCAEEDGQRTYKAFCIDENHNHVCDYKDIRNIDCTTSFGEHQDLNKNHICDYKDEIILTYTAAITAWEKSHTTPLLALFVGPLRLEGLDTAEDELEYIQKTACKEEFGARVDSDKNHKCDYCGGDHGYPAHVASKAAVNGAHFCDYCAAFMGDCKDSSRNHYCDYGEASNGTLQAGQTACDKTFGYDANGECPDLSPKDHMCDWCGSVVSKCIDINKDHRCDICGKGGVCFDDNKDHFCDLCSGFMLECPRDGMDRNHDHFCDYKDFGCEERFCATCAEDEDACNGECEGKCADTVLDHKCDYCRKTLTKCVDKNGDLRCDICGKIYYTVLQAFLMVTAPFILLCILLWGVQLAKIARVNKIRIEFYKDLVVYVDKKQKKCREFQYRTFLGAFSASVKYAGAKGKRHNYGTVTIFCPGGPAMSMTFHNIDNPGALVAYLNSKKPEESVSYNASYSDMLN